MAATTDEQAMRAQLRVRFCEAMERLSGAPVELCMHERTRVDGRLLAWKPSGDHLLVEQLRTPIGQLPRAVVRVSDLLTLDIPVNKLPNNNHS